MKSFNKFIKTIFFVITFGFACHCPLIIANCNVSHSSTANFGDVNPGEDYVNTSEIVLTVTCDQPTDQWTIKVTGNIDSGHRYFVKNGSTERLYYHTCWVASCLDASTHAGDDSVYGVAKLSTGSQTTSLYAAIPIEDKKPALRGGYTDSSVEITLTNGW